MASTEFHTSWSEVNATMVASVRSVGTACALTAVGVYLHRRGFIVGEGKRTLALLAQQVTIPLFLFSKLVDCNRDWSDEPCPSITESLEDGWFLLLWPIYVVGWGLLVGYVASFVSNTPKHQRKAVLAACAFGNSTGLPITLLTVVHANFPATTELGAVDPTLFLSVYLLFYPILQWGVGGWLLAPNEHHAPVEPVCYPLPHPQPLFKQLNNSMYCNVLNNNQMEQWYSHSRRGIGESDASMYISSPDLVHLEEVDSPYIGVLPTTFAIPPPPIEFYRSGDMDEADESMETTLLVAANHKGKLSFTRQYVTTKMCAIMEKIVTRCLQPPVVGAMLGLIVAATPIRGLFVDLVNRQDSAPLEWLFDALRAVGQAAVPINMIILGCNLSQSVRGGGSVLIQADVLSSTTMLAIAIGKMIVMPIIGVTSTVLLKNIQHAPESINAPLYLVAMIVFITPTANNVMIMVELSGSGTNEGIAKVIAWQYAMAPLILSVTMTLAVGVASQWT